MIDGAHAAGPAAARVRKSGGEADARTLGTSPFGRAEMNEDGVITALLHRHAATQRHPIVEVASALPAVRDAPLLDEVRVA